MYVCAYIRTQIADGVLLASYPRAATALLRLCCRGADWSPESLSVLSQLAGLTHRMHTYPACEVAPLPYFMPEAGVERFSRLSVKT
jgi:hypothetical protein